MSDSAPDREPQPQPKRSGGPPRPPKKTARGLEDGSPGDDYPIADLVDATLQTDRLIELLESIRGSRLVALNRLETPLLAPVKIAFAVIIPIRVHPCRSRVNRQSGSDLSFSSFSSVKAFGVFRLFRGFNPHPR